MDTNLFSTRQFIFGTGKQYGEKAQKYVRECFHCRHAYNGLAIFMVWFAEKRNVVVGILLSYYHKGHFIYLLLLPRNLEALRKVPPMHL